MYFSDLSEYRYGLPVPLSGVLNVGWLSSGMSFPRGEVPPALREAILTWTFYGRANVMRGEHRCELCSSREPVDVEFSGRHMRLGSAEIWLPGGEVVYAAPNLLWHYVERHRYLPPLSFLEAVQRASPVGWDAEVECNRRIGEALKDEP